MFTQVYGNTDHCKTHTQGCVGFKPGTSIDTIRRLTRIQNALGQDGSELGHDVIVLVVDHLGVQLSELVHLQGPD